MPDVICNTSPLLYLYRIGVLDWLPKLFNEVWITNGVKQEMEIGQQKGYNVPKPRDYEWIIVVDPQSMPSEWLSIDLGMGELSVMALALENSGKIILSDDALARRHAKAAGLTVWGTLKVLLEAKSKGITESIKPLLDRLEEQGMWLSEEIRHRILRLAGEKVQQ